MTDGAAVEGRRPGYPPAPPQGLVAVLDGPAPTTAALARRYAERLPAAPALRRSAHGWEGSVLPAADVEFGGRLHHVRLPSPGCDAQLEALVARVLTTRLAGASPPWRTWLVDGLAGGRWALVCVFAPSVVADGDALAPLSVLFDVRPSPSTELVRTTPIAPLAPIAPRTPFPTVRQVAAEALRLPSLVAGSGLHAARAVARRSLGRMVRATADPVDARRYRATTVELADVDAVAAAGAATRDGVLHAMVDRAWGHVLATRGMGPADGPTGIVVPGMVAGPERPARVLGARLDRVVPCRPVPDGARATVAGVAYDGRLSLGISCAPGFAPDAEQFTRALGAALHRFRRATGATGPSRHDTAPRDAPDRTTRRVDMSHLRT